SRRLYALAWFGSGRDTAALRLLHDDQETYRSSSKALSQYLVQAARAYTALERGDYETALQLFGSLPDSLCGFLCLPQRLEYANLRFARGDFRALASDLERWFPPNGVLQVERYRWMLLRARVAEGNGETKFARGEYVTLVNSLEEAEGSLATIREEAR